MSFWAVSSLCHSYIRVSYRSSINGTSSMKHIWFMCHFSQNISKHFLHFLQFHCCSFDFRFYILDILKNIFYLSYSIFGRILFLHMPQVYVSKS